MQKIILIFFWIMLIIAFIGASAIEREYILLDMSYKNLEFFLLNKSLEKGNYPIINHDLDELYSINLKNNKGSVLYTTSFNPSFLYTDSPKNKEIEGGVIELNDAEFYLIVPNYKEGDKVEILKNGEKIFEEEIYNVGAKLCRIK